MSACTAVIEELHQAIVEQRNMEELEGLLWAGVLAYQNQTFYTLSGLEFSYTVKHKKNGDYSGELLISRKETSKTLTRSSVMLAFHKVLAEMKFKEINGAAYLLPPGISWTKINRADLWNLIYLQHVSGVWPDPYK